MIYVRDDISSILYKLFLSVTIFLQQALEERSALQSLNAQLQHKLAEYFKKKKVCNGKHILRYVALNQWSNIWLWQYNIWFLCFQKKILSPLKLFWIFFLSLEWWATAGDRKECDRSGTKIPQIYVLVRSTKCCNLENDFISCLIYSDCETYIGGLLCGIKLITLSLILKESFLKHFFLTQLNHSFDGNNLITLFCFQQILKNSKMKKDEKPKIMRIRLKI